MCHMQRPHYATRVHSSRHIPWVCPPPEDAPLFKLLVLICIHSRATVKENPNPRTMSGLQYMNCHLWCCFCNSPRFTGLFVDPCREYNLLRPIPFTWHFWASLKILCTHSQTTLSLIYFALSLPRPRVSPFECAVTQCFGHCIWPLLLAYRASPLLRLMSTFPQNKNNDIKILKLLP